METLHEVKQQLKIAKGVYNEERKNLDAQTRDKALQEMLQKQRTLERMQFIRAIIDFDLPEDAVALQATNTYFRLRWIIEDAIFARQKVSTEQQRELVVAHRKATEDLQRCHNDFYDAVDLTHAQTIAKEHALGIATSLPLEVKKRYAVPKRKEPSVMSTAKPGGFIDMCTALFAICFLCAFGYGLYWCGKQLLTLF